MRKVFWMPLLVAISTMVALYGIENLLHIGLLRFSFSWNEPLEEGLFFAMDIAVLPFVIGILAGFLVERKLRRSM
ncbi:hypothetical protein [Salimicrobium halophilum]|uniref:Uncharacterized protein n=1 Tax=Salimicrobium halophilum TaxID=86666 RepID=A0A1G8R026_9BACI|nr:hypothetical protein [Salimicrobium halophilum]SDJ10334.1 hypothetical protein SAMN04490247_0736 [Salimicrobium halophilum]